MSLDQRIARLRIDAKEHWSGFEHFSEFTTDVLQIIAELEADRNTCLRAASSSARAYLEMREERDDLQRRLDNIVAICYERLAALDAGEGE